MYLYMYDCRCALLMVRYFILVKWMKMATWNRSKECPTNFITSLGSR